MKTSIQFRFLLFNSHPPKTPILNSRLFCSPTALLSSETLVDQNVKVDQPKDSTDVFRKWGCTENDISTIFSHCRSLPKTNLTKLQSRLGVLSQLGLNSTQLIKIVHRCPRFLYYRIDQLWDERLQYLQSLFGSREVLLKAIIRNPSLLTRDFHNKIKPVIASFNELGISRKDLVPMILSRPTMISRSILNDEKLDYIRKTRICKDSKMYKYAVSLIAISRLETIQEKVVNFEKFGLSDVEVFGLFGRSPFVFTLSIDKVKKNMTFVVDTMKLPASVALECPFLLWSNLESVLKPRLIIVGKIQEMGLVPQIKGHHAMLRAFRMKEKRFVEAFISCHPKDVANELMECYTNAKCVKQVAESSKKYKGFPL